MNPFLFRPHPLVAQWLDLVVNPAAHRLEDFVGLGLTGLALTGLLAGCLLWLARKAPDVGLGFGHAFVLALPAAVLYLPPVLTVMADVVAHRFRFQDRFILVFTILVLSQALTAFYGFAIRSRRNVQPVGLVTGLTVSLSLLLLVGGFCLIVVLTGFGTAR